MTKELIKIFLEAFAEGDAYGKATEYCSREDINKELGSVKKILPPENSLTHEDLAYGQVTDDTEQNVYLIEEYVKHPDITAKDTALCLLRWITESDALKYIGPSSLKALESIRDGADINTTGITGTTCGGIMRSPAAVLLSRNETELENNVVECLKPTHNTSIAMESAMAYAFALIECSKDETSIENVYIRARIGASRGRKYGNRFRTSGVAPSLGKRLTFIENMVPKIKEEKDLKILLYDILGTTLASYDVAGAAFAIFQYTNGNTMEAIRIATETGGDTDTIAALSAGLCAMYSKSNTVPEADIKLISKVNNIDFDYLASSIDEYMNGKGGK